MYYKTLTSALLVGLSGASPLAVAEPESQNSTSLDSRAVLNTQLYAVYNTEKWATTVAPGVGASDGGEEVVLSQGFNIVTDSGAVVYSASDVEGKALCLNAGGGMQMEITGGCFVVPYRFSCAANFAGDAGSCAVWGPDDLGEPNTVEDCEDANSGVSYTAFTAGSKGQCVIGFIVDGDCNPENAIGDFQMSKISEDTPPPCNTCPGCD